MRFLGATHPLHHHRPIGVCSSCLWHPSGLNMPKSSPIPISVAIIKMYQHVLWWAMPAHLSDFRHHQSHKNNPGQESFLIWHKRLLPVLHDLIQPPRMSLFDVEIIAELLDEKISPGGGKPSKSHKLEAGTHTTSPQLLAWDLGKSL